NCARNPARRQSSLHSAATERSGGNRESRLSPDGRSGPHFSVAEKADGRRFQRLQGKHADPADPTTNGAAPDRKDQSIRAVPARQQKGDPSAFSESGTALIKFITTCATSARSRGKISQPTRHFPAWT